MFDSLFTWLTYTFFPFLITREWLFVFSIMLLIIIFLLIRKIRVMKNKLFESSKDDSLNISGAINVSAKNFIGKIDEISKTTFEKTDEISKMLEKSIKTTKNNERWSKSENKGEKRVKNEFEHLFYSKALNDIIVYHDLTFRPNANKGWNEFQCDHVILTPHVLIVVETKYWHGTTYVTDSSDFIKLVPEKNKNLLYAPTENSNEPPIFLFNVRESIYNESIEIKPYTPYGGLNGPNVLKHLQNKTRALYNVLNTDKAKGLNTCSILLFVQSDINNLYFQPNRESNSLQSLQGYIVISKLADLEKAIAYSDRNQSQTKIDESTRKEIIKFMEKNAKCVQDAHNPECREIGK